MKPQTAVQHLDEDQIKVPPLQRADDHALVKAAMSGDTVAFDALVVRYRQLVLNFVRRLMQNSDKAEDAVQETFMKAFASFQPFNSGLPFPRGC